MALSVTARIGVSLVLQRYISATYFVAMRFFSSASSSGYNFYAMMCRPDTVPKIAYDSSLISLEY